MSSNRLRAASTACFASAVLGALFLPSFVLTESQALQVAIPLASLGLYMFFMLTFRNILIERLSFHRANRLIPVLIAGHAALATASVLDEIAVALIPMSLVLAVGGCFVAGVSAILLGIRLLPIRSGLGNQGIAYAILQVCIGVSFATVYLIPVAIGLSVLSDMTLGTILVGLSLTRLERNPA